MAVEIVSHWVNQFDLQVVPVGRKIRAVALPYTQPKGLRVKVLARRSDEAAVGLTQAVDSGFNVAALVDAELG